MTTAKESFQNIDQSFLKIPALVAFLGEFLRLEEEREDAALVFDDDFFAGVFLSAIEFAIDQLILQDKLGNINTCKINSHLNSVSVCTTIASELRQE
jgi:hypothetical protein